MAEDATDPLSHGLYPVFADWAKRHGIEAAVARFSSLPEVRAFEDQWRADLEKVVEGGPPIIAAGPNAWYSGPSPHSYYWGPLKRLYEDAWPKDRVSSVDRSSTMVVAHTPFPGQRRFAGKGLVVGYVQSGKTTNFTAVTAKLADEDYKMVIVLSGIHNGLRSQTQARLNEQLRDLSPDRWFCLTDEDKDFHKPTFSPAAVLNRPDSVALAVVKKNAAVLRRLIGWLNTSDGRAALQNARVLVIDDEADQASVATSRINPLIRRLLNLMPRSVYIGYTATPFANVFINPTDDDLYPRDFILNLPRPENYFGPELVFGREDADGEDVDGLDMVRRIPDSDIGKLRPLRQQDADKFAPQITEDLLDAVYWFWLATAARRARADAGHSTMLIHTSVKISVHNAFLPPLRDIQRDVLSRLRIQDSSLLERLRKQWESETKRVPAHLWGRDRDDFLEVIDHLEEVVSATRILMDNYRSEERLEYGDEPVVAIVVGGNTLSRGLTLEGLVVSLFVRGASAYDTLLQMGRWFGYREGYEDLPRIWTTRELELGFRHIAQVEHEMRSDIDLYQLQNATPLDIAVRVRTHPSLQITAKMGAAAPAEISYAGRRLQTRFFAHRDEEWLRANLAATSRLLTAATQFGSLAERKRKRVYHDVPVSSILAFLAEYRVHEDSPDMDTEMLRNYIDQQISRDTPELTSWNVAVVDGTADPIQVGPISIRGSIRSKLRSSEHGRADIKTLMSKQDLVLDLDLDPGQARRQSEVQLKLLRSRSAEVSTKGLLVIYAIDPVSEPETERARASREALDAVAPVIGIGMVFPGVADSRTKVRASHVAIPDYLLGDVEQEDIEEALELDDEDHEGEG